jgi:exosortase A
MSSIAGSNASGHDTSVARPWQHALLAMLILSVWILFLYRDTVVGMVTIWSRSDTFAHGFLVPPIVLWLVWRQRETIATQTPRPAPAVFVPVGFAALLWLLGDLVAINAVTQLSLVLLLVLVVPAVMGMPITRLILFPLGFLFFSVPVGEFMLPQLMEWTADFTVMALRLSGIPVYREGLQFVIPSGNWSVVEACSGVRYLIASLTVGTLFAYINYQSLARRILFVIVSILVPVIANWLRAYMIVMLGHYSGNTIAVGFDHLVYGWVFFGVVIMLMFFIGSRWAEPDRLALSADDRVVTRLSCHSLYLWLFTASFAALAALPNITLWALERSEGPATVSIVAPARLSFGWSAIDVENAMLEPAFHNPSAYINRSYVNHGEVVGMYLGYYRNQNYDRKLVTSGNVLVVSNDPRWKQVASGKSSVILGGEPVTLLAAELRGIETIFRPTDSRLITRKIYWVNGTLISSDYLAKIYGAIYRLMGRGDDSAVIIIYAENESPERTGAVLDAFLATNYVSINELLLTAKRTSDSGR